MMLRKCSNYRTQDTYNHSHEQPDHSSNTFVITCSLLKIFNTISPKHYFWEEEEEMTLTVGCTPEYKKPPW